MMKNNGGGTLFVVSGFSGSGKSTLIQRLLKKKDDLFFSISATTRAPRGGEKDGEHYHFLTHEKFLELAKGGHMLEWAQYVNNYYGTPLKPVMESLNNGQSVLLEIEVQGAKMIKEKSKDAVLIFVMPPSEEELEQRLRERKTESEETISKRLAMAKKEREMVKSYDHVIINDDIDRAVNELLKIIESYQESKGG